MAIMLYGVYFHRLMAGGWPIPLKLTSLLTLVSLRCVYGFFAYTDRDTRLAHLAKFGRLSNFLDVQP